MKYCVKCGAELYDEAYFCPKCGCLTNDYTQNFQGKIAMNGKNERTINNEEENEKVIKFEKLFQIFSMISTISFSMVFLFLAVGIISINIVATRYYSSTQDAFITGYAAHMTDECSIPVFLFGVLSFVFGILTFIFGLITKKRNTVLKAICYFVISCSMLVIAIANIINVLYISTTFN